MHDFQMVFSLVNNFYIKPVIRQITCPAAASKLHCKKLCKKLLKTFFSQPFFPWLVFLSPTTITFTPLQSSYFRQLCAYLEMALVMNFSWKFLFAGWYAINPSISHIANLASSVANYCSFTVSRSGTYIIWKL